VEAPTDLVPRTAGRPAPSPRRPRGRRAAVYVLGGLTALGGMAWIALRIEPAPLPVPPLQDGSVASVPLPEGLPAPVDRFYRTLYGDEVPAIETAVITGRGTMRVNGIRFPVRWRFSHIAGQDYRHYIEVTAFGRALLTVNEWFLEGTARLELPFGTVEGPRTDQGANLALWAEAGWFPSYWVTDPRVRWETVDDTSARLIVPFGADRETFTVSFDPATGLLKRLESLRFKGEDDPSRTLWLNEALTWGEVDGLGTPTRMTVTWADEGTPWAHLTTEEVILNADLDAYISAEGP
jgi:hypothetical protein